MAEYGRRCLTRERILNYRVRARSHISAHEPILLEVELDARSYIDGEWTYEAVVNHSRKQQASGKILARFLELSGGSP